MNGKNILLGVTGGIAAYKSCMLVREIVRNRGSVQVIMTEAATQFVAPLSFATLSGRAVLNDMFPNPPKANPVHLQPAEWGDILVVAPATANYIGKLANGIADDLLSTVSLAFNGTILLAPAMNPRMWSNPAVQENVAILRRRGVLLVGPEEGDMGGMKEKAGIGRMSEPLDIYRRIEDFLSSDANKGILSGKNVLVTSGPTREAIDPVRYVSNRSSGKMGDAIAVRAMKLGADVTLIRGKGAVGDPPENVETKTVETAAEMAAAVKRQFDRCDVLVMTAAVSDWTIVEPSRNKLKKRGGAPQIQWKETEDILDWAGKSKKNQIVVGFALETDNHEEEAREKLKHKTADMIVLNDPTRDDSKFGGDTSKVIFITDSPEPIRHGLMSKSDVAEKLFLHIHQMMNDE